MGILTHLTPKDVFGYFEALTALPHGSGDMEKISGLCMDFAKQHGLEAMRDAANNVIIKKPASRGYEAAKPVILQGHLDMVCQKTEESDIDFEKDGLTIFEDGEYIRAKGTTLGADNGIAVAMMLAILADNTLSHPPIEAVFTTDEEIGMVGAKALDCKALSGKRMINMDSEDPRTVTVSCAGGSDLTATLPILRTNKKGEMLSISVKGLRGGHSGVEIHKGGANANILMGRMLHMLQKKYDFDIISVEGGDKRNAIPVSCTAKLCTEKGAALLEEAKRYTEILRTEISVREPDVVFETELTSEGVFAVMEAPQKAKLIHALLLAPSGVMDMSAEIEGLVETSLNLGVLQTKPDAVIMAFALRSSKKTALAFLEEKLRAFFLDGGFSVQTGGHYPPWEYKPDSEMRRLYMEKYQEKTGNLPRVEAIHAGLECGVFADAIEGLDCISIGPEMHGIHTVQERLSIKGTQVLYEIVLEMLRSMR